MRREERRPPSQFDESWDERERGKLGEREESWGKYGVMDVGGIDASGYTNRVKWANHILSSDTFPTVHYVPKIIRIC